MSRRRFRVAAQFITLCLIAIGLVVVVLLLDVGITAVMSRSGSTSTWAVWANIGQTFESVNAVFSGLAFAALIVTFWIQLKELREQRLELQLQREAAKGSREELHRSAMAELRGLHIQLIRMSIDDPELAAVWPPIRPDLPASRNRQYLYANLILQHAWEGLRLAQASDSEIRAVMRYLFASPLLKEYWLTSASERAKSAVSTDERRFAAFADDVCGELVAETGLDEGDGGGGSLRVGQPPVRPS
jgi:hypothetical protein